MGRAPYIPAGDQFQGLDLHHSAQSLLYGAKAAIAFRDLEADRGGAHFDCQPSQHMGIELSDMQKALDRLPTEQREMLMLIASGMSYE